MKKCTWCGKEYPDTAERCSVDEQPLTGGEPQTREPGQGTQVKESTIAAVARPELIDLSQIEGALVFSDGYSRPNWRVITEAIQRSVSPERIPDAWTEAAVQWARQIGLELGREYGVTCFKEFVLLSALGPSAAERLLLFAETTRQQIRTLLRDAVWKYEYGKHVIFLFAETDAYYQYVSYFLQDGVHPTSSGCLIHKDYAHIAMPYLDGKCIRQVLTHELVHNNLVHLQLPQWLNEGLAVMFERTVAASQWPILDHDLRERHLRFWGPENIQKFWSGVSFGEPGESNELSYSLAEILVNLLIGQSKEFVAFVKQADWNDAGQTAAVEILGIDLGQTAATFLGKGNWRPNRTALVECWTKVKKEGESSQ